MTSQRFEGFPGRRRERLNLGLNRGAHKGCWLRDEARGETPASSECLCSPLPPRRRDARFLTSPQQVSHLLLFCLLFPGSMRAYSEQFLLPSLPGTTETPTKFCPYPSSLGSPQHAPQLCHAWLPSPTETPNWPKRIFHDKFL